MSITLMHYFKAKVSFVENVCPGIDHLTLTREQGLIEVKAVQIERQCRDTKSSKPNTNHRPGSQEEVQAAAVVERCILEDQTSEVSMSSNDVIRLFFLAKLVAIVLTFRFSSLTHKRGRNKGTVHSTE